MVSNGKLMAFINALGGGSGAPSAPADVVILPETELTAMDEIPIATAPNAMPEVGSVCAVTYNGTAYDCPALAVPDGIGMTGVLLGDASAMGILGGNETAPFLVVLFDEPLDTGDGIAHGLLLPQEGIAEGASITLSIVQTGGASDGATDSPVFIVKVNHSSGDMIANKTYAETLAALRAGKIVCFILSQEGLIASSTNVSYFIERITVEFGRVINNQQLQWKSDGSLELQD